MTNVASILVDLPTCIYIELRHLWRHHRHDLDFIAFLVFGILKTFVVTSYFFGRSRTAFPRTPDPELESTIQRRGKGSAKGSIGVVVAVLAKPHDEIQFKSLIRALTSEQKEAPARVVVVDDGSPEPLSVSKWAEEMDVNGLVDVVRLHTNQGPACARNMGIRHFLQVEPEIQIVGFTDLDCLPSATWVETIHTTFSLSPRVSILSGRTISAGDTYFDQYHNRFGTLNGRRIGKSLLYGPTCNLAVRRSVLDCTRFDNTFPCPAFEDVDFCLRARSRGNTIVHVRDMVVTHVFEYREGGGIGALLANAGRLARQFAKYGRWEKRVMALQPEFGELFSISKDIGSD
ncbi:hypothetical protein HK102_011468 [Quaeritorhiza haematococci]|nr:hypothetical protein HK102_011468 [Quaeritorhiza haematococci]